MPRVVPALATVLVLVIVSTISFVATRPPIPGVDPLPPIPKDPKSRKEIFFEYLHPVVRYHNARIAEERASLLRRNDTSNLDWFDEMYLASLRERYQVDEGLGWDEAYPILKRRVNVVPASLVLAQAAKESGWGRSRFAQHGNALFGERCFTPGCGLPPKGRRNPHFEVESFDTIAASVESYMLNLNTHDRYLDLRIERSRLTREGKPLTGSALAKFTAPYSERGDKYVKELIALITHNELDDSTQAQTH